MLTLRALLADESLGLKLVAADNDALDRELWWVHTTELIDPSKWLQHGELVLTNGLWLSGPEAEDFVSVIVERRAAGLVFGLTDERWQKVPESMIKACQDAGLPLLTLAAEVSFAGVTQVAARLQSESEQEDRVDSLRYEEALVTEILRGRGAVGVLSVLNRKHHLALSVVDRRGQELASVNKLDDFTFIRVAADALAKSPPPLRIDWGDGYSARVFLVEGAMGDVSAGLFCLGNPADLSVVERQALEQAARFLSLEVHEQQAVLAIETRFSVEMLEMALSGTSRSRELAFRLRNFGIDPMKSMGVYALAFSDGVPPYGLEQTLRDFYMSRQLPACIIPDSNDTVMIFSGSGAAAELHDLATDLSAHLAHRRHAQRPIIGIGNIAEDSTQLGEAILRARAVCRVLAMREHGPNVASFDRMGTHMMLLGLQDASVLRRLDEDELRSIRHHDSITGSNLEYTLRSFLAHDCSWVSTANDLFIHVNTLRNRLARISELTGRDLNRFEDRVDLFLALKADAMIGLGRDGKPHP